MLVPVLRPLTLGEVLDTSFAIYRRLFAPLLFISVLTQTIPLAIGVYVQAAGGVAQQPALWVLSVGLTLVLSSVGTAASTFVVADTYLGSSLTPQEAFLRSTPFMGRLIGTSLLVSLVMGMGFLLFIVPGVIAACGLLLTPSALVLEDIAGGTPAMARSWELTRGFRIKIFGALLVAFFLLLIPGIALGALALGSSSDSMSAEALTVGVLIVQSLLQILVYPYFYVLTTVLYYDLRVRKEGFDLERLATSLQQR
ncbi:MAG: hypothetical protein IPF98_20955 [Gemmatimonadetes bacterium]|nr:hypothetical protein [Gemmatimonadota bacterium]